MLPVRRLSQRWRLQNKRSSQRNNLPKCSQHLRPPYRQDKRHGCQVKNRRVTFPFPVRSMPEIASGLDRSIRVVPRNCRIALIGFSFERVVSLRSQGILTVSMDFHILDFQLDRYALGGQLMSGF